jgi:hypothetical protein
MSEPISASFFAAGTNLGVRGVVQKSSVELEIFIVKKKKHKHFRTYASLRKTLPIIGFMTALL